jgi:hypothetical protein
MQIKHNGKEYSLKRLTLQQELEHLAYLKNRVYADVKKQMVGLPLEICKHAWDAARAEAKSIEIGTKSYRDANFTFDGAASAMVLSVGDKDFTAKDAMAVMATDPVTTAQAVVYDVLGYPPKEV